ncbi:LOW QUALITY PROTEIN: transcription initiation factor TFIID subunit 3-like [Oppia nitens]|uniref:LOW QUALITY PROTEIN: transcription initiation factor TFIID subunit 3-like n=1 Tax=Oppia nitens TaxID=1686743 RepID=UPI0023DAA28D|nr:LOW QUALITY PROTEIN: transcription initiation factor TFIID subunit 3-like [Oppia nitens]
MVVTYSDAILRTFVAQICRDMGWHASHETPLEVLTQITAQYVRQLSKQCVRFANHCGRQKPIFDDMQLAFNHFNIDLNELKDYIKCVESQPLDILVPKYPIKNVANRVITNTGESEDRPEWYNEWMPPLRESRQPEGTDDRGEQNRANDETLQDSLLSPSSTSQMAGDVGSTSPLRSTVDTFSFLRDLHSSITQREGRLPDTQRIIESEESRENSPEKEIKVEDKPKLEEKEIKDKKKEKDKKKKDKMLFKGLKDKSLKFKHKKLTIKPIKGKKEVKTLKDRIKIKDLPQQRSYSPLSIKVVGLSTGTPTATSTPTMARSPASITSPNDTLKSTNTSLDSCIEAVIDRICCSNDNEVNIKDKEEEEIPKRKYKIKKEDSIEKSYKKNKKDNASNDKMMNDIFDEVVRQSESALMSPNKRSPYHTMSPKVKTEAISSPIQSKHNVHNFDDDEAAKTLVLMAGEKTVSKRKKNKASISVVTSAATACSSPSNDSNSSAFQSAMSAFPKVSPGSSPLSPNMLSTNQNPFIPTRQLFARGDHSSPPLLTPAVSQSMSTESSYGPPPVLTKPKTLAEKKALPPEIENAPLIKKEKDKENKTEKKEKEKNKKEDKKSLKQKNKKFKSKAHISDDSSSEEETKPKINIKLGSKASVPKAPNDKLAIKTTVESKAPIKTLLSPKHNVQNPEEVPQKKKEDQKRTKDDIKPEIKTKEESCILIRETITVKTEGDSGKVWICPSCKLPDDGSPMIGCDTCDDWYHYACVGIKVAPEKDESWFCEKCVKKQQQIESKFIKKKEPPPTSVTPPKKEPKPSNKPPAMRPRGRPRKDSTTAFVAQKIEKLQTSDEELINTSKGKHKPKEQKNTKVHEEEEEGEYICPQCDKPDDGTPMIGCDKCDKWYHWQCVGILTEPKADSNWMCPRCKKKKQIVSAPPKPLVVPKSISTSPIIALTKYGASGSSQSSQWQCPECKLSVDNTKPSICCDDCDCWYHWSCVGITQAPREEESWFCKACYDKQAIIAYKYAKVRRI